MKNLKIVLGLALLWLYSSSCFSQAYTLDDLNIHWLDKGEVIADKAVGNYFVVLKKEKQGVRNAGGDLVVPFDFDQIGHLSEGWVSVKQDELWGFYDYQEKKMAIEPTFLEASHFKNGLADIKTRDGKTAQINKLGELVEGKKKGIVYPFPTVDWVKCPDRLWRLEKKDGTPILPCTFNDIKYSKHGVIAKKGKLHSFFNSEGTEILPSEFGNIRLENKFLSTYKKLDGTYDQEVLVYDLKGNIIVPDSLRMEWISLSGKRIAVYSQKSRKWKLLDENGEMVFQNEYDRINKADNNDQLYRVISKGKKGIVNDNGEEVLPIIYKEIGMLRKGLIPVQTDQKWGAVDSLGRFVVEPFLEAMEIYHYSEGFYLFRDFKGKVGVIDHKFNIVIEPIYDKIKKVNNGTARVLKDGNWGVIDVYSGTDIPTAHGSISKFDENGFAVLRDGDKKGIINRQGEVLVKPIYERVYVVTDQLAMFFEDKKIGFYNFKTGEEIPAQYEMGVHFNNGFAAVRKGSKWGIMDHTGNLVLPLIFESTKIPVFADPVIVQHKGRYGILRLPLPNRSSK